MMKIFTPSSKIKKIKWEKREEKSVVLRADNRC